MAKNRNEYDITKDMIDALRGINTSSKTPEQIIKEEKDENGLGGAIAITDDPKFGQNVLTNQIDQFRQAVDSGAEFSDASEDDVESNPLIFIPKNKNLIFSGIIPRLNNLKFQFLLKTNTGEGCFIWCDGLILNAKNITILSKMYGFYENWCKSWNTEAKDFSTLVNNLKKD